LHRGHGKYVLVISAPELGLVLDVLPDRNKATIEKWLDERGKTWCEAIEVACSDMWDAYQTVAAEKLPNARRIVDRFHVMKNLNDALTKAQRAIQKEADEVAKEILKGCRWLLVKNKENLKAEEQQKLDIMLETSSELKACVEASSFRALQSFVKALRN
jgi:transposase